MRSLRLALPLVALGLVLACSGGSRDKRMGERCASNDECQHGLCIAGVSGDEGACTKSCGSTDECPRGWACSGVTDQNVLVCARGAPTPFGIGARE